MLTLARLARSLLVLSAVIAPSVVSGCAPPTEDAGAESSGIIAAPPDKVEVVLRERVVPLGDRIEWLRGTNSANGYTSLFVDPNSPTNDPAALAALRSKLREVRSGNPTDWRIVYGRMSFQQPIAGAGIFVDPPSAWPDSVPNGELIRLNVREDNAIGSLDELLASGRGLFSFSGVKVQQGSIGATVNPGTITPSWDAQLTPTLDLGFEAPQGKATKVTVKMTGALQLRGRLQSENATIAVSAKSDMFRLVGGKYELPKIEKKMVLQAGPVPVLVVLEATPGVTFEAGGSAKLERATLDVDVNGELDVTAECTVGAECMIKPPASSLAVRVVPSGTPDDKVTLSGSAAVFVKTKILLYGLAGPEVSLNAPTVRAAAVGRQGTWRTASSVGVQLKTGLTLAGLVGPQWEGPLCNMSENGQPTWQCYPTQSEADEKLIADAGGPAHDLVFPALFDDVPMKVSALGRDRIGTVLSLYNPTASRASVIAVTRDEKGNLLSRSVVPIAPRTTVEVSSIDGRTGVIFDDRTRGQRFSLELIPDERIAATALLLRVADDGQPLGTGTSRPVQLASIPAVERRAMTADVVFSQLPNAGRDAGIESFDSEAYVTNPSDRRVEVAMKIRCRIGEQVDAFALEAHATKVIRIGRHVVNYDQCALHLWNTAGVALTGTALWANPGIEARSSAFIGYNGSGRGEAELLPARVMWRRTGFNSGVSVQNVGDRPTRMTLSFLFEGRLPQYRTMTLTRDLNAGQTFMQYMDAEPIEGVPPPIDGKEERTQREGTVTVTSTSLDGSAGGQPLVVNVNGDNRSYGGSWTVVPTARTAAGTTLHMPGLYHGWSAPWVSRVAGANAVVNSGITITNASTTEPNRCTIEYVMGGQLRVVTANIGPSAAFNHFLPAEVDGVTAPNGYGSATVRCSGPAAGEVSVRISDRDRILEWLAGDACDMAPAMVER